MPTPEELRAAIDEGVLLSDRHRLERSLQSARRRLSEGKPADRSLAKLAAEVDASRGKVAAREAVAVNAGVAAGLPIAEYVEELKAAIDGRQVVIVCGETGSGKSTQLPKVCLQLGRGRRGMIGHTQPRRIAARSIAARLSDEMNCPLGGPVGFQVRFQDRTGDRTLVKLMTDGILLAETGRDRFLSKYDTLIIDEAHERSLNIDFLLGYIRRLLPKRPDLKLVITSATLDAERFAEHFSDAQGPAPVVNIPGRTFPVDIRYRPLPEGDTDYLAAAATATCDAMQDNRTKHGDVLVFLPTERDIRDIAETLRGRLSHKIQAGSAEVLPLYGRLSVEAQSKVFAPSKARRVVLATNVAESSLTVPNVRTVIDPGLARISRFSAKSKVQRLPIEPVSKASCNQRAGRCGRVGPGVCIRLYSEENYESREPYTPPEILRTNLASVILQIESLKLGRIDDFPFLEPPKQQAVSAGYKTLFEIGALDADRRMTEVGRQIGRMPVDPRIGRILLAGRDEGVLREALIVASVLEVRDPRDRPPEKKQAADEAHAALADESSDFATLLKMWDTIHKLQKDLSKSKFRKALQQNFLSYIRTREWQDVHRQLRQVVRDLGWEEGSRGDRRPEKVEKGQNRRGRGNRPPKEPKPDQRLDAVHRSVLAGMLSNVGRKADEGREFIGPHDSRFFLWPGSVLAKKKPKWVVAAELVETERRYARTVGPIRSEWIEPLARHLVTVQQFEPHYSEKAAAAMVYERVLLWGLTVVPKRRTKLARFDEDAARELFIREGLVEGRYESKGDFRRRNSELKDRVAALQDKSRRADMLLGEEAVFDFYNERVPPGIADGRAFEKWRSEAEQTRPDVLVMSEADLLADPTFAVDAAAFPDAIDVGSARYPVSYAHNPGNDTDGVTLRIPREAAGQIDRTRLGWLVPGLLEEKVAALLRTLPKEQRRQLVPIPDTAKGLYPQLRFGEGDLLDQLGLLLRREFNMYAPREAFDTERLPPHLQMRIAFAGETDSLPRDAARAAEPPPPDDDPEDFGGGGYTAWTFGPLPASQTLRRGGLPVTFTPAIIDEGRSVAVTLIPDAKAATRATVAGLTRLLLLADGERIGRQVKHFPKLDRLRLLAMKFRLDPNLEEQLAWHLAGRCVLTRPTLPRTAEAWAERVSLARNHLAVAVQDAANWLPELLSRADAVLRKLDSERRPAFLQTIEDLRQQWELLIEPDVLIETPAGWLPHVPRFFEAMLTRLRKLEGGGLGRDRKTTVDIGPMWDELRDWWRASPAGWRRPPELTAYRWLFEEYRVMQFAQEIRTVADVSEKSIREAREAAAKAMMRAQ